MPALVLDGRRIQTTGAIARELDRIRPDPPLLPADPEARAQVEAIEAWCDRDLQQMGRRLVYWALVRHGSAVDSYLEGSKLILPRPMVKPLAPVIIRVVARGHDARDEAIRQDLAALPGVLDRIDGWIADGVLGGSPPNVADYQVATSLALLMAHEDLRPIIAARPAGELSRRLAPAPAGPDAAGVPSRVDPDDLIATRNRGASASAVARTARGSIRTTCAIAGHPRSRAWRARAATTVAPRWSPASTI